MNRNRKNNCNRLHTHSAVIFVQSMNFNCIAMFSAAGENHLSIFNCRSDAAPHSILLIPFVYLLFIFGWMKFSVNVDSIAFHVGDNGKKVIVVRCECELMNENTKRTQSRIATSTQIVI